MRKVLAAFFIGMFWIKCSTVKLQCDYKKYPIKWAVEFLMDEYTCVATINFEPETEFITKISHNHLNGQSEHEVKAFVYLEGQKIPKLPKFGFKFFPCLEGVRFSGIGLEEISSRDLVKFPIDLKLLYLNRNKLTKIPSDLFEHTPHLQYLTLRENQIKHVGYNFFNYLNFKNFKKFSIDDNVCTKFPIILNEIEKKFKELKLELKNKCKPTQEMIDHDESKADEIFMETRRRLEQRKTQLEV